VDVLGEKNGGPEWKSFELLVVNLG
jgi:hypothetical protein